MIYQNEYLNEISFPLGGIGTGSIGLAGNGEFVDWEIFNHPAKTTINPYTHFAVRAEYPDGRVDVRVLQGDHKRNLNGQIGFERFHAYGFGPHSGTMAAFPHFGKVTFDGRFPIAALTLEDEGFPAEIVLTAYNPMIPHEADDSSLPVAMFDVALKSRVEGVRYTLMLTVRNPFGSTINEDVSTEGVCAVMMKHAGKTADEKDYGDLCVATSGADAFTHPYWYRGQWKDGLETYWRELTEGNLTCRSYDAPAVGDVCGVGCHGAPRVGEEWRVPFVISWNIPNCYNYWNPWRDENGRDVTWKNYYATRFEDSVATARYALAARERLYAGTLAFCDVLHGATLDPVVIEAVSSTLSVLKSPTVLRLEDGTFWGWEGVHESTGSCEGTCTHVWSYAYALCFLYPELERSIRETEFNYDTDADGKMGFRTLLPLGRGIWAFRACLDGQMASVIKTYREWKISGDDGWLRAHWEKVKLLIGYAWSDKNPDRWDADRDGILEGRQHHTLDLEMFGPSGWLEGLYLAALRATEEMAEHVGERALAAECRRMFENGREFTKKELFNGEYFIQKVDLSDVSYTQKFHCPEYWNAEKGELKYQLGQGCEIDQLLGQWHADLCGLGEIFDAEQRKTALRSMMKYIFKPALRDTTNVWRVFALGDEAGSIMCDYPEGAEKPVIPLLYNGECMTGFEYAFAGQLIREGMIDEGLRVIHAVRDRYDGYKRNPFNELECGSNYARAMASFALLPIFSGFTFDMTRAHLGFSPLLAGDFRCLWSVGGAWGNYERTSGGVTLTVCGGTLSLSSLTLGGIGCVAGVACDGCETAFRQDADTLYLEGCTAHKSIAIRVE